MAAGVLGGIDAAGADHDRCYDAQRLELLDREHDPGIRRLGECDPDTAATGTPEQRFQESHDWNRPASARATSG